MTKKRKTIAELQEMARNGIPHSTVVCYNYIWAKMVDQTSVDMILVGDSMGNVEYGYDGTVPVTMDQIIDRCKAVRNGAPNTFIMGDMPFGSYQASNEEAVHNAVRIIKEGGCDAVKLEGGRRMTDRIRSIVDAGIVVIGHIGLTPQSIASLGGFKAQGRDVDSARELIQDAYACYDAGVSALLVEAVPAELMDFLRKRLDIPVFGCGVPADGQGMNYADMFGLFSDFVPKFAKQYAALGEIIIKGMQQFDDEVKSGVFPGPEHAYHIKGDPAEYEKVFREFER